MATIPPRQEKRQGCHPHAEERSGGACGCDHPGKRPINKKDCVGLPTRCLSLRDGWCPGEPAPANLAGNRLRVRVAPLVWFLNTDILFHRPRASACTTCALRRVRKPALLLLRRADHLAGVNRLVEFFPTEQAKIQRFFPQGRAVGMGRLGDLRGVVVADVAVQRRNEHE